jgi:ParB-like nuclease domain
MDYRIHPLAQLFPDLSPDEFEKLKGDIHKNGQIEPIWLNDNCDVVLDGRHRLRACKELGIKPWIAFHQLLEKGRVTEAEFIWSRNVLRRHLTDDQRAAIAVKWSDAEKQAARQRQREHGGTAPGRPRNTSGESAQSVRTREVIAVKAGVSEHKVRQAEVVAAKAPHLTEKVAHGEIKLKEAVAQTVAQTTIKLQGDTFNEQAALVRLYRDWEMSIERTWPKNRDLTPVIRKVHSFAAYLESLQKARAAELQKKIDAAIQ